MATTATHIRREVMVSVETGPDEKMPIWIGSLTLLSSESDTDRMVKYNPFASDVTRDTDSSDGSFTSDEDGIVYSNKDNGVFSFFQKGDGSDVDPDGIPTRYLRMAQQDRKMAQKAVQKTIEWREEQGINTLLNDPHVNFDICKQVVPHVFIGRDVKGHVVYVQQPARLNMEQAKANGLDYPDLLRHAIYIQEYLWQIVEAEDAMATITSVIDVGDLRFHHLRQQADRAEFLKEMGSTFDAHWPMRAHKTFIVNAPKWFHLVYRLIKPLLRKSTTDMVEICTKGKQQDAILKEHLGEETSKSLPDFCWSDAVKKGRSGAPMAPVMERELRDFVMGPIKASGQKMSPVLPY